VSGIAGPGGGSEEKPVGTVWFGFLCGEHEEQIKQVFSGNRDEVRQHAISFAITQLIKMLSEN
jgi:nicotinamide-nucleotide amidase